mmetsp:Transcript_7707/g.22001  ORF Transcript_7707/g.22001 Transcript_7707/m.22001 type:complete len:441 (-) Transcript_7707:208-1530(-)
MIETPTILPSITQCTLIPGLISLPVVGHGLHLCRLSFLCSCLCHGSFLGICIWLWWVGVLLSFWRVYVVVVKHRTNGRDQLIFGRHINQRTDVVQAANDLSEQRHVLRPHRCQVAGHPGDVGLGEGINEALSTQGQCLCDIVVGHVQLPERPGDANNSAMREIGASGQDALGQHGIQQLPRRNADDGEGFQQIDRLPQRQQAALCATVECPHGRLQHLHCQPLSIGIAVHCVSLCAPMLLLPRVMQLQESEARPTQQRNRPSGCELIAPLPEALGNHSQQAPHRQPTRRAGVQPPHQHIILTPLRIQRRQRIVQPCRQRLSEERQHRRRKPLEPLKHVQTPGQPRPGAPFHLVEYRAVQTLQHIGVVHDGLTALLAVRQSPQQLVDLIGAEVGGLGLRLEEDVFPNGRAGSLLHVRVSAELVCVVGENSRAHVEHGEIKR